MTYREKFNIAQRNEIRSGLESGIDISIYAKLLRKQSELV